MNIEQATFTLDSLPGQEFTGFTTGETWNGWAVPAFEFDEAERILDALTDRVDGSYYWYNRAEDAFYYSSPDELEEAEKYQGVTIEGLDRKVYPIGAFAWTWEKGI